MNLIARLEYELTYYDSAVHRFNHYTTMTPRHDFLGSGTKLLFTLLSLRFFDMRRERETHTHTISFYADFSIWPHHVWHPAANYWSGLGKLQKSTCFVQAQISTHCFFQIPKSSAHRFQAWRHSRRRSHFLSGVFIMTSVIVTSSPRVREHLHSMCTPN